jgi:hypothetical protein
LHGGFLELRRVHLVRYLEHFFFPSFRSSLYATCWKAKFQGKLTYLRDVLTRLPIHWASDIATFAASSLAASDCNRLVQFVKTGLPTPTIHESRPFVWHRR